MNKKNQGFWYYLSLVTELGFVMASCILIGLGIGLFLDSKFNLAPWGVLIFLLLGIGAAFVGAYRMIMEKMKW
jgi:F0F1-type ATP synthase assembly protein I